MSRDRRNLFYTRLEDLLKAELGIPEALLQETLSPFFDQIAISVWSLGDLFAQAKRMGWPMSFEAGLEILSVIENRDNPGEQGINWEMLFTVIEQWAQGMDWENLSESDLDKFQGDMLILCEGSSTPKHQSFHKDISLRSALEYAQSLLAHACSTQAVQIYCVDPEKAEEDLTIALKGNLIRTLLPQKAMEAVG